MTARRPGRRTGEPNTKDEILTAARKLFSENGFERTTLRQVAQDAAVDVALISHYFGNKRGLFVASIEFPSDPVAVLAPMHECRIDDLAEVGLRAVLGVWTSPAGPAVVARFRQAVASGETDLIRDLLTGVILAPIRERLHDQTDLELRLSLYASQIAGLLVTRELLTLPAVVGTDIDRLVEVVAPNLQRYLTGKI
ncbi:TetR/AcrR family transcriptional regulator [Yimella sp. cx-573]|nr:TetR/AcrR family transcriptional regulator [Yimella sp. cx-573]